MLRPPQPAVYLFLLDVSSLAQQSGYLDIACQTIQEQLDNLPGDARTQVGFIAFNSAVHFYNIAENFNQPHEITVLEVDGKYYLALKKHMPSIYSYAWFKLETHFIFLSTF